MRWQDATKGGASPAPTNSKTKPKTRCEETTGPKIASTFLLFVRPFAWRGSARSRVRVIWCIWASSQSTWSSSSSSKIWKRSREPLSLFSTAMRMASLYILVALISSSRSLWIMSLTVLPIGELERLHVGDAVEEEDALHEAFGVFHFADRLHLDVFGEAFVAPVFAHLGVEKILVDRGEFFAKGFVELFEYGRVTFHAEKDEGNETGCKERKREFAREMRSGSVAYLRELYHRVHRGRREERREISGGSGR